MDKLEKSIREHGVLTPLIVTPDGRVLAGSKRLMIARKLSLRTVPAVIVDYQVTQLPVSDLKQIEDESYFDLSD